jgi:hypothetical protein
MAYYGAMVSYTRMNLPHDGIFINERRFCLGWTTTRQYTGREKSYVILCFVQFTCSW